MVGFKLHNIIGLAIGLGAGILSNYWLPYLDWTAVAAIMFSGYLGIHLPAIQQPSTRSYQIIRASSAVAALLLPFLSSLYRPTDILLGWLAAYLFYHGVWWLIDRISLYRDYTHHISAVVILPLVVSSLGYFIVGQEAVVAIFLTVSSSYILHILLQQRSWLTNSQARVGGN